MADIFWLASYPKSGNTWLRILLANYLSCSDRPLDINKLNTGPIASSSMWFNEWAGVEAAALDDALIERLRPDVYRCMSRVEQKNIYIKVHDAWRRTDRGEGLFPADITGGVVYILRNPLDMAASYANHRGETIEEAVEHLCDPDYARPRSHGELSDQVMQKIGSWGKHVVSWLDDSGLPVHLVRYEDLKRHPEEAFGGVVRFCGLEWDGERIRRAVAFSDFEELQRQERATDFVERSPNSSAMFFRRGQVGSWREELPEELVRRIIETQGATMRRFGYLGPQ